jgi:hypothetical protein
MFLYLNLLHHLAILRPMKDNFTIYLFITLHGATLISKDAINLLGGQQPELNFEILHNVSCVKVEK